MLNTHLLKDRRVQIEAFFSLFFFTFFFLNLFYGVGWVAVLMLVMLTRTIYGFNVACDNVENV